MSRKLDWVDTTKGRFLSWLITTAVFAASGYLSFWLYSGRQPIKDSVEVTVQWWFLLFSFGLPCASVVAWAVIKKYKRAWLWGAVPTGLFGIYVMMDGKLGEALLRLSAPEDLYFVVPAFAAMYITCWVCIAKDRNVPKAAPTTTYTYTPTTFRPEESLAGVVKEDTVYTDYRTGERLKRTYDGKIVNSKGEEVGPGWWE